MPYQYINELLDLPELKIVNIEIENEQAVIEVTPVNHMQDGPYCHSTSVKRNGIPYKRNVRHLAAFGKTVDLRAPAICLACNDCYATFTWEYAFVEPKKRYTKAFSVYLARQTYGSTVIHTSMEEQVPYSTMERIFKSKIYYQTLYYPEMLEDY
ncbi:hypothetical protein GCM10008931_28310 [Oceanobacillus oncorhynchi subsp. oncorhynchi]|uniref:hypothetical protein n=1 Tax=Oceanobacillus oncorhynchi TaxID=545501 RepID=UPI0031D61842